MTKYEWERELKRNISRMPAEEVSKVLDYYDELFEDKAESGLNEAAIIREFGNPFDVAHKILNEYEGELKTESFAEPPKFTQKDEGRVDYTFASGGKKVNEDEIIFQEYKPGKESLLKDENLIKEENRARDNLFTRGKESAEDEANEIDDRPEFVKKIANKLSGAMAKVKLSLHNIFESDEHKAEAARAEEERRAEIARAENERHTEITRAEEERRAEIARAENARQAEIARAEQARQAEITRAAQVRQNEEIKKSEKIKENKKLRKEVRRKSAGTTAKILFIVPFVMVQIVIWSVVLALTASGFGLIVGGIAEVVYGFIALGASFNVGLAQIGMAVVCVGAGILLSIVSLKLIALFARLTARYFGAKKTKNKNTATAE